MKKALLFIGVIILFVLPASVTYAQDDDPVSQCAQGIEYYQSNDFDMALSLLELGFNSQTNEEINNTEELAICAYYLGMLRRELGDVEGALFAFEVSLTINNELDNKLDQGILLNAIGQLYVEQEKYELALSSFNEALNLFRELQEKIYICNTLDEIYRLEYSIGEFERALSTSEELLKLGRELENPEVETIALIKIGIVYEKLYLYDDAIRSYKSALEMSRKVGNLMWEMNCLLYMGSNYHDTGWPIESTNYYKQALDIAKKIGADVEEIHASLALGELYLSLGDFNLAEEYVEYAMAITLDKNDRGNQCVCLLLLGNINGDRGNYGIALDYHKRALSISREIDNISLESTILNDMGIVYNSQGNHDQAVEVFNEAMRINYEIGDIRELAANKANLGYTFTKLSQLDLALDNYQEALKIFQEINDKNEESAILVSIAEIYYLEGRGSKALELYNEALSNFRTNGNQIFEASVLQGMANVYASQKNYDMALDIYLMALQITQEKSLLREKSNTLASIGEIYNIKGDITTALDYYKQAIDSIESIRIFAGSSSDKATYVSEYIWVYDAVVELCSQLNMIECVFETTEKGRARSFYDSLATGNIVFNDDNLNVFIENEKNAYLIAKEKEEYLNYAIDNGFDSSEIEMLENEVFLAEETYNDILDQFDLNNGPISTLIFNQSQPLTLNQVQDYLDQNSTLISYWVLSDAIQVLVISQNSYELIILDISVDELNEMIRSFYSFSNIESSAPPKASLELYNNLFFPLLSRIDTDQLMIIPHQALHYIPFAALNDGNQYLIEQYSIVYLPTASMLQYFPKQNESVIFDNALIFANPQIETISSETQQMDNLPYAADSAKYIGELFDSSIFIGDNATEMALRNMSGEVDLLHIGTHGFYNIDDPMQSVLQFTSVDASNSTNDGQLHVEEIYSLNLENVDLVVLSACETNIKYLEENEYVEIISDGDEIVSMTRAFLLKSPRVISTLWSVDEIASSYLIEKFYTYLHEGFSAIDALRLAQLDTIKEYPHPYFWGGYILSGDGGKSNISDTIENQDNDSFFDTLIDKVVNIYSYKLWMPIIIGILYFFIGFFLRVFK